LLIAPEDRQLALDDVQGMFVLLGGGILLAVFILLIEYIKQKREKRKVEQINVAEHSRKKGRSKSLINKETSIAEPFKPLTAY